MIRYVLPWPDAALSPNSRCHWAVKAKKKAALRAEAAAAIKAQGVKRMPGGSLTLELEFVRPTRRKYDRDNLVARLKSAIDGMCDALRINDNCFTTLVSRVDEKLVGGFVRVLIYGDGSDG